MYRTAQAAELNMDWMSKKVPLMLMRDLFVLTNFLVFSFLLSTFH